MKSPRRFLIVLFMTLVVLSSSVFSNKVYALDAPTLKPSIQLNSAPLQIQALENKKQTLAQQLDSAKSQVDTLNQQLAQKKATAQAEQDRVDQLKNMFVHIDLYAPDSSGNLYDWGNCTWYAKSRRPDASNSWGNANTWYETAADQGWSVGLTPKKGAIATSTGGWLGHVAYVEGVSLDDQWVTISEMNVDGLNVIDSRTVYYTDFQYIYQLD